MAREAETVTTLIHRRSGARSQTHMANRPKAQKFLEMA
jgi:hypothetical protein